MNCEEIEKDYTSNTSASQQATVLAAANPSFKPDINFQHVESVLLTKLQAAVSTLEETNSIETTVHQCQVIKACSEALLAIRQLTTDTPTQ